MVTFSPLVFLFAVGLVNGFPSPQELGYPENFRDSSGRIVSGWEAHEGQIPYQLSLRMVNPAARVFSCGATLIHNEWALTAAHCTSLQRTIVIRAGAVSVSRPALIFETTEYYNHPLFVDGWPFVQRNDIGVIKLDRYLEYSDMIQPIRLQPSVHKDRDYSGITLQASGWGLNWTRGIGVSPDVLNWVYLVGVSNPECLTIFGGSSTIAPSTICASAYNISSQSTCDGDSGGPLVEVDVDGKPTQVGVTSFVSGSGYHTDFPAGFIRPGHYLDWIREVTGINFDWDPESIVTPEEEESEEEEPEDQESDEEESSNESDDESSESNEDDDSSEEDEDNKGCVAFGCMATATRIWSPISSRGCRKRRLRDILPNTMVVAVVGLIIGRRHGYHPSAEVVPPSAQQRVPACRG